MLVQNKTKGIFQMKNKHLYEEEKNPFQMVIYIILVLALLAGIGYLAYRSYIENLEQEEHVRQAAAQETEYESEIREKVETQSETSTTTTTEDGTTVATTTTTEDSTTTTTDASATAVTEGDSETSAMTTEEAKKKSITVLNATGVEGVAAKWQESLTEEGYKNLTIGSYNQQKTTTIICTPDEKLAQTLKSIFTDATIQDTLPTEGIDVSLDDADACVIIGTDHQEP